MQENSVMHVRCAKLQEVVALSEQQIMRQADSVRRLEFFVDPDVKDNAALQLSQTQQQLKAIEAKSAEQARPRLRHAPVCVGAFVAAPRRPGAVCHSRGCCSNSCASWLVSSMEAEADATALL